MATGPVAGAAGAAGPDGLGVAVLGPWVVGVVSELWVGPETQPRAELATELQVRLVQMVIQI